MTCGGADAGDSRRRCFCPSPDLEKNIKIQLLPLHNPDAAPTLSSAAGGVTGSSRVEGGVRRGGTGGFVSEGVVGADPPKLPGGEGAPSPLMWKYSGLSTPVRKENKVSSCHSDACTHTHTHTLPIFFFFRFIRDVSPRIIFTILTFHLICLQVSVWLPFYHSQAARRDSCLRYISHYTCLMLIFVSLR